MNLSLQDLIATWGPTITLGGFIWFYFNKKFDKVDEKIDSLKAEINNVEKNLKAEINNVEKRLDEKINNVEKRLDEKISSVEKRLDEKISGVEKRLDEKINNEDNKLGEEISSATKILGEKVDAVRDKVNKIDGQLDLVKIFAYNNQPLRKAS